MFEWMAWTPLTATFFIVIAAMLVTMTVWEKLSPTVARAGWLRFTTTRGERLFIALLVLGWINIFSIGFFSFDQWFALIGGLVVSLLVLWKG